MKTIVKIVPMYVLVLAGALFLHYNRVIGDDYQYINVYLKNYGFNLAITLTFLIVSLIIVRSASSQLAYAYMGFVGLKFILFFFLIYPDLSEENPVTGMDGHVFLVPFLISLFAEILVLIGLLKEPQ